MLFHRSPHRSAGSRERNIPGQQRRRRRQSGQAVVMVALGAFLLACFAMFTVNTGSLVRSRLQAQNTADSVAISGTAWMARELNMVSMTNIAMAMTLAEATMLKSVFWTTNTALIYAPDLLAAYCLDPLSSVCLEAVEEATNLIFIGVELDLDATTDLVNYLTGTLNIPVEVPTAGTGLEGAENAQWETMKELSDAESGMNSSFPVLAEAGALSMGTTNGATAAALAPMPKAPIEVKGVSQLCTGMVYGRKGGYEFWDANLLATAELSPAATNAGPLYGTEQLPFLGFFGDSSPLFLTPLVFPFMLWGRTTAMCYGTNLSYGFSHTVPTDSSWFTDVLSWFEDVPDSTTVNSGVLDFLSDWLQDPDADKAKPMMLTADWKSKRSYDSVAFYETSATKAVLAPDRFQNNISSLFSKVPVLSQFGMVTLAKAELYNPYQADTFTPQWRVRLVPLSLQTTTSTSSTSSSSGSSSGSSASSGSSSGGSSSTDTSSQANAVDSALAKFSWFFTH